MQQELLFSRISRSLIDISRNLILVEFGRLVESSRILRRGVDISRNPRLIDFSRFLRF